MSIGSRGYPVILTNAFLALFAESGANDDDNNRRVSVVQFRTTVISIICIGYYIVNPEKPFSAIILFTALAFSITECTFSKPKKPESLNGLKLGPVG